MTLSDEDWFNDLNRLHYTIFGDPANIAAVRTSLYALPIDISGASAGQIVFPATANPSAGANVLDDYEEGSYTGTLTGCTTAPTYTIKYTKIGNQVTIPFAGISPTGTSNATTKTITGMPADIRPAATINFGAICSDNGGANTMALAQVLSSGVISFNASITAAWTSSGTAQMSPFCISYTTA